MNNNNEPIYASAAGRWMLERFYQRTASSIDWLAMQVRLPPADLPRVRAMCRRLQVAESTLEDLMEDVAWSHQPAVGT